MRHKKKQKPAEKAVWLPDPSTPMFVSCSACQFRVETLRAVETGWSSREHVGIKYRFCPACGKPMSLHGGVSCQ